MESEVLHESVIDCRLVHIQHPLQACQGTTVLGILLLDAGCTNAQQAASEMYPLLALIHYES